MDPVPNETCKHKLQWVLKNLANFSISLRCNFGLKCIPSNYKSTNRRIVSAQHQATLGMDLLETTREDGLDLVPLKKCKYKMQWYLKTLAIFSIISYRHTDTCVEHITQVASLHIFNQPAHVPLTQADHRSCCIFDLKWVARNFQGSKRWIVSAESSQEPISGHLGLAYTNRNCTHRMRWLLKTLANFIINYRQSDR